MSDRAQRGGWRSLVAAALAAGAAALAWPSRAFAAGAGADEESLLVILSLIGAVATAYLLTHFVVGRLQRTFLVVSGIEYLILGYLIGPQMPASIPAFSNLEPLLPVVALAVGWIGLLRGMELSFRRGEMKSPEGTFRVVITQATITGVGITLVAHWLFTSGWLFPYGSPDTAAVVGDREAWVSAAFLGCAAAASSVDPVRILRERYEIEGKTIEHIRRMAALSDLLAIIVFGLLFCIFHKVTDAALAQPSPTEWAVVTVALGALLGILFTPFLGDDDSENGRFLAMVGIITFAAGAAYFLDLSPLLVNLCLGAVLVNTARTGKEIRATLERTRRPMTLVLFVFAGALWLPVDPVAATLASVGYVVLRMSGKALGTSLAGIGSPIRGDYYRGLLAHGEVTIAMAISFRLVYEGAAADLAYTVVLVSVVAHDLVAPRVLRGLLVDTGDIRGERERSSSPSPEAAVTR